MYGHYAYYREGSLENQQGRHAQADRAYYREGSLENPYGILISGLSAYYREGSLESRTSTLPRQRLRLTTVKVA